MPVKQGKNKSRNGYRWPKGVSGNPAGRPKKKTLMEVIRDRLRADGAEPSLDDIATQYIAAMRKGSFQHLKEYIDREEGKVPERLANADGENLSGCDLSKLTTDELTLLRALRLKSAADAARN